MCGIAGVLGCAHGSLELETAINAMTDALAHRGPDGEGHWLDEGIAIGHRRLAIIDIEGGRQPFVSEDGRYVLSFNGEIYNYRSLRRELKQCGESFVTESDTEVLLRAWMHWGPAAVNRIHGIFAFAIWDSSARKLWLVRDRLGIKPLYVSRATPDVVHFASELKAIVASPLGMKKSVRWDSLVDYFTLGYVPPTKSILRGVQQIPPGTFWCIDGGSLKSIDSTYWSPEVTDDPRSSTLLGAEELWEQISAAVSKQLVADVPVAAFLSGGVDSSAVVAAMGQHESAGFSAYSIAVDSGRFDESRYAAMVAERYKADHRVRPVSIEDSFDLDAIAEVYDEPFADSSSIPTIALCQFAADQHKVALSGDGGDEVFLGYPWQFTHARRQRVRRALGRPTLRFASRLLSPLISLSTWAGYRVPGQGTLLGLADDPIAGYVRAQSISPLSSVKRLLSEEALRQVGKYETRDHFVELLTSHQFTSALAQAQFLDLKMYLPGDILTKVDRASMSVSLEVRVPLLDEDLLGRVLEDGTRAIASKGKRKGLLIDSVRDHIPWEVIDRPKQGFSVPLNKWFREMLGDRLEDELRRAEFCSGILRRTAVRSLLKSHREGRSEAGSLLWAVLVFSKAVERIGIEF